MAAIDRLVKIFATPVPAFFMREKPISSMANPACMNRTSTAATITHMVFTGTVSLERPIDGLGEVIAVAKTKSIRFSLLPKVPYSTYERVRGRVFRRVSKNLGGAVSPSGRGRFGQSGQLAQGSGLALRQRSPFELASSLVR